MPTPDPIALPELPQPEVTERVYGMGRHDFDDVPLHFTADQMRAYGQACVDAAHPIPADMVLVPRRATPEMLADFWYTATGSAGGGFWLTKRQLARARKAYAAMLAAAPPLNELLGQPEEFNLNEVSGNSGQLASLEQRARELLDSECPECGGEHGFMQPGGEDGGNWHTCSTCRDGERLRSVNRDQALRAITAALNEASRAPQ